LREATPERPLAITQVTEKLGGVGNFTHFSIDSESKECYCKYILFPIIEGSSYVLDSIESNTSKVIKGSFASTARDQALQPKRGYVMMTTKRVFLAISILLVFSFVGIYAQQTTGTISGTVADETGGVLPGVSLTARNTGTEATRTVVSDDEGRYRLPQLVPGDYELQAELAGFQTAVLQGITLSMAQQAVVSVTLRVGEISEQVVVSAEVSLVETTTANVGGIGG